MNYIAVLFLLASSAAPATPIDHEGELGGGSYSRLAPFALDYGMNVFRDSAQYDNRAADPLAWVYDFDGVRFNLPGPARVAISITPAAIPLDGTRTLTAGYGLIRIPCAGWCDFEQTASVDLLRGHVQPIALIETDWREWYLANYTLGATGPGGGWWHYKLMIDVERVLIPLPEPTTILLMLIALVGWRVAHWGIK